MPNMEHTVVWTEIPVRDLDAAMGFYAAILGKSLTRDDSGPNPIAFLPYEGDAVAGHLYPGEPAAGNGPTVHLAMPGTAEEGIAAVRAAGGQAHDMVIEIPPGRFAYGTDPDGNSIGLFEAKTA